MPEVAAVVKAGAPASNPPTPLQLLNSECQRRRVALHDNKFVAGHCFFEAFGVSSNITLAFGEGNGAVLIRRSIAFGYEQQQKVADGREGLVCMSLIFSRRCHLRPAYAEEVHWLLEK